MDCRGRKSMIESINTILKEYKLSPVRGGSAIVSVREMGNAGDVTGAVREFAPEAGWICFTDEVVHFSGGTNSTPMDGRTILSGEVVKDGGSLHIRQAEEGWLIYAITGTTDGDDIVVEETFVSIREKMRLKY